MAEKTVPWWRRALQFALGGIRSGFGLFQRGAKAGEVEVQESARGVEAIETGKAHISERNDGPASAQETEAPQDEATRIPQQIAIRHERGDLAVEIPPTAVADKTGMEIASNLPESERASEKIEATEIEPVEVERAGIEPVEMEGAELEIGGATLVIEEALKVVEQPVREEKTGEEHIKDEPISEERLEVEKIAEEPAYEDPIAVEPVREELTQVNAIREEPVAIEEEEEGHGLDPEEAMAVEQEEEIEAISSPEPAIAVERAEPTPVAGLEVRDDRLEAEESDAAVDDVEVEPAQVTGEVEAERVETTAAAEPNEVYEAAITEPTEEKLGEELERVEAEVTAVSTEADAPAEERVEEVKEVNVPAEEPVAAAVSLEPEAVYMEEPEIAAVVPDENTEPQEDAVNELVSTEPELAEEDASEAVINTEAATAEEWNEDPAPDVPEVAEVAKNEGVVETQVAGAAESTPSEETSTEAQSGEQEAEEPASKEGPSPLAAGETEAKPEPEAEAIPEAETAAEAVAETVAAPAQLELIPKPQMDEKAAAKLAEQQRRRKEAEAESPFSVMVGQVYEGPLDLLLDLIRKQDIDIYDIPIAKITAQFLAYVNQLKASDVDVAGEFIYTASLLIHIKSKMLLPRTAEAPGEAAEDPRRELVERLLEHERFKNAAQMLQQKQMMEAASWSNPGYREFVDDEGVEPEIAADTVDLVKVFREILERARNRPVLDVEEDTVTVGQMIQFLGRRLMMEDKPIALRKLLSHTRSERALIAMFLALLELVRLQAVLLRQDKQFSEIFIKKHAAFDTVMNEGLAHARDDWR